MLNHGLKLNRDNIYAGKDVPTKLPSKPFFVRVYTTTTTNPYFRLHAQGMRENVGMHSLAQVPLSIPSPPNCSWPTDILLCLVLTMLLCWDAHTLSRPRFHVHKLFKGIFHN